MSKVIVLFDVLQNEIFSWLTGNQQQQDPSSVLPATSANRNSFYNEDRLSICSLTTDNGSMNGGSLAAWKGWKHARQELITGQCHYTVHYLGSTLVRELRGIDSTRASIGKLKCGKSVDMEQVPKIELIISCQGVRFDDFESKVRFGGFLKRISK